MPKQTPAEADIAEAGAALMGALMRLHKTDPNSTAIPLLRTAIYHTTLANLALICPEELEHAEILGRPPTRKRKRNEDPPLERLPGEDHSGERIL